MSCEVNAALPLPPEPAPMRILIVEDEPKTAAYVRKGLTEHAYIVDVAHDGIEGLHLATSGHYDLILLDVMLPGADGWTVLESLRRQSQTPVLFLSARDQVADRVKGLELGADDYLVKPFAFSELLARIRTLLRRGAVQLEQRVRVADLDVDMVRRRVTRAGERIDLTAKEYALLDYFVRHVGEVVSRTLIAEHVWDMNFDSDTNVVDVAVRRLRAKIDERFEPKLIHTIRGVGYVLDERSEP
jgi:two-component system, OmpR family, copper resistance phosphate regulon response regulator CusR